MHLDATGVGWTEGHEEMGLPRGTQALKDRFSPRPHSLWLWVGSAKGTPLRAGGRVGCGSGGPEDKWVDVFVFRTRVGTGRMRAGCGW